MENKKKLGRGWLMLVAGIAGSVLLLTLYVGAYYATVRPVPRYTGGALDWPADMGPMYGPDSWREFYSVTQPLFWPIHQVDRMLRPDYWYFDDPGPDEPKNLRRV